MPKYGEKKTGTISFSADQVLDFWSRQWRREYLATQPPRKLQETLERARARAAERPHSYLARHLAALYGVEL